MKALLLATKATLLFVATLMSSVALAATLISVITTDDSRVSKPKTVTVTTKTGHTYSVIPVSR